MIPTMYQQFMNENLHDITTCQIAIVLLENLALEL